MYRNLAKCIYFTFLSVLLISGCGQNDDIAMLYSYPKYGHCSIDSPARGETITIEEELLISGWAYDENRKKIPSMLVMYFVNEDTNKITVATVTRGEKRADVAKALENPALIDSGFSGTIDKSELTTGKYHLILLQVDQSAGVIACAGVPHKITLQ